MRCAVFQLPRKVPECDIRQALKRSLQKAGLQLLLQRVHAHTHSAVWTRVAWLQGLLGQSAEQRRLAAAAVAEKKDLHALERLRILRFFEKVENGRDVLKGALRGKCEGETAFSGYALQRWLQIEQLVGQRHEVAAVVQA